MSFEGCVPPANDSSGNASTDPGAWFGFIMCLVGAGIEMGTAIAMAESQATGGNSGGDQATALAIQQAIDRALANREDQGLSQETLIGIGLLALLVLQKQN